MADDSPTVSSTSRDPGGPPPPGVDVTVAHPARVWNFWLGGSDYFKADRIAGTQIAREFPHLPEMARVERAFLVRAMRFLAGPARVRQFLDLGSGLPAGGNTHEIAQRITPDSTIVYVDNDQAVLAHAKALLDRAYQGALPNHTPAGTVTYVDADLRDVTTVLAGAASTLDHYKPIALIMLGVLGYISDHDVARSITSQLLTALPSGSYLAIADGVSTNAEVSHAQSRFNSSARTADAPLASAPYHLRRPEELAIFFAGLDLVEPGVVPCPTWKPDRTAGASPDEVPVYCGVARKP